MLGLFASVIERHLDSTKTKAPRRGKFNSNDLSASLHFKWLSRGIFISKVLGPPLLKVIVIAITKIKPIVFAPYFKDTGETTVSIL